MDSKYSGCNIVESTVKREEKRPPKKDKRNVKSFLLRTAVAAVAVGFMLVLHFAPSGMAGIKSVTRRTLLYDVFGRGDIGSSAFFK